MENVLKKIGLLILIIALISISSLVVAFILSLGSGSPLESGNVAVIPIYGVISTSTSGWGDTVDPVTVRAWLDQAEKDDSIKAIVLEINSPGGSAVASDEIGQALKHVTKPTVAHIREVGASGGYWIASNADYIIANRMSITGSIGVTASYIDFAGTLERYNATYEQITGGDLKELGSPWSDLNASDRAILEQKVERIHQYFIDEVTANRNLTQAEVDRVKTGEFLLGDEAKDLGLVDELGDYDELDAYLNKTIGEEPQYVYYKEPKTFVQELGLVKEDFMPNLQTGVSVRT